MAPKTHSMRRIVAQWSYRFLERESCSYRVCAGDRDGRDPPRFVASCFQTVAQIHRECIYGDVHGIHTGPRMRHRRIKFLTGSVAEAVLCGLDVGDGQAHDQRTHADELLVHNAGGFLGLLLNRAHVGRDVNGRIRAGSELLTRWNRVGGKGKRQSGKYEDEDARDTDNNAQKCGPHIRPLPDGMKNNGAS